MGRAVRSSDGARVKLKGAELLLLLLLLSRKRSAPPVGPGEWEPEPGPDNLGTAPLPPTLSGRRN